MSNVFSYYPLSRGSNSDTFEVYCLLGKFKNSLAFALDDLVDCEMHVVCGFVMSRLSLGTTRTELCALSQLLDDRWFRLCAVVRMTSYPVEALL